MARLELIASTRGQPVSQLHRAALTHRIAVGLQRRGVITETPVAVLSENTPIVFPVILGIMRAGCTWVALNARSSPTDLAALLDVVGARILLFSSAATAQAEAVSVTASCLETCAPIEEVLDSWLAPAGVEASRPELAPEATAAYFGTGGTTGQAKAVAVPHRAFETMVHAFNMHLPEDNPIHLVAAPVTHSAGACIFPVLSRGGTNVIHDRVDPAAILSSIESNRISRLFLPPTAIYSLLAHPDLHEHDYSSLRYFLYGAAPMSIEKLREAMGAFGPVMAQFYGQTELPMLCTFLSPAEHEDALAVSAHSHRLGSCGRPTLVANLAIMSENGEILARGEKGEIVVRSALQMVGYHNNPDQTASVMRPGHWLGTGDVGYIDADGYVYIVDRARDMIISGGFNVFPSEVEQVLWAHPGVADCAVIGVPDDKWGERVTAVVELKAQAEVTSDELISICRERLGGIKAPKEIIFRELPRSPVGKVLKRSLRDEYWSGLSRQV